MLINYELRLRSGFGNNFSLIKGSSNKCDDFWGQVPGVEHGLLRESRTRDHMVFQQVVCTIRILRCHGFEMWSALQRLTLMLSYFTLEEQG